MSGLFGRVRAALVTSFALALAALALMSLLQAKPQSGADAAHPTHVDGIAARPWCGAEAGTGARSCRYWTFEQCLAAARADYRTCKPNPAAVVAPDDVPYWTYRSVFL
jgi:hypothetical protein